ncbi:eukaryotic initiation factor 3 d subunit [Tribonema minus]|uniref:Eukaryotic translation initiation factor 3 subunit D n=1 Tax=Tribonema minus TaxID=303371 RepID=A0A835Z0I8_9STRA|nr:eukaryotic initiation factor 3 d subunit [Tribonema minus]
MAQFTTPKVHINTDGWGPTNSNLPQQFLDVPYAPFGKSDRIGRAADFTAPLYYQNRTFRGGRGREEAAVNTEFQYKYDKEDDAEFELVDTTKTTTGGRGRFGGVRNRWQQGRGRGGGRDGGRGGRGDGKATAPVQMRSIKDRARQQPQGKKKWNALRKNDRRPWHRRYQRSDRQASVKIQADWQVLEELDLPALTKLTTAVPTVTDLQWCGFLDQYDESYDTLTSRNPKRLRRHENKEFYFVTTTDDPVIERLTTELENAGAVFATDAILSHLMAAPRSVFPWDVVIQKVNGTLFMDKRDNSQFDFLTVNETAYDTPAVNEDPENINNPDRLSLEATMINQNFSQQILKDGARTTFDMPNPFFGDEEGAEGGSQPSSVAYRYRRFSLGPELNIVARCELHGIVQKRGEQQYMTAYALNEWDSKLAGAVDWRQKLDSQRGAVLATELKNNAAKLAKWTAQSIIAGADQMKLGFVSRATKSNAYDHVVLGTQFYKPNDFARQITLDVRNMWGIVKEIVELIRKQEDGKFVVMRDPNKAVLRIYSVPLSTFEDEDEEEQEEEEEEEA